MISLLLLFIIYRQVAAQLRGVDPHAWQQTGWNGYLLISVLLVFVNVPLEAYKWYTLANSVEPVSYRKALGGVLSGIALSMVTPNHSGDYPARIAFLARSNNTLRYVNVSVLGAVSQLWAIFIFGFFGLVLYNVQFAGIAPKVALVICIAGNVLLATIYWRFESWVPALERVRWLKKFALYGRLPATLTSQQQLKVLALSLARFSVFTAQYLILLRWMNVDMPVFQGYFLAALFFWILAVIPSIALTELGVRGAVCLYLFGHFSTNSVGILAATAGIWMMNLVLPSIAGSILLMRMRFLR